MTTTQSENMLLQILAHGKIDPPPYILNPTYHPEGRDSELLEDSDFMFLTGRHPDHMLPGLRATAKEMAALWRKAGQTQRATVFQNVAKSQNN